MTLAPQFKRPTAAGPFAVHAPADVHVAVLMGGWSSEREVSLNSGRGCAAALREAGYQVSELDVTPNVFNDLRALAPDVAFNALHGPFGEDGCMQAFLETLAIPYTHSGVLASALAMHKEQAKIALAAAGVPVAESRAVMLDALLAGDPIPRPFVVKPIADGSSHGVFIVTEGTNFNASVIRDTPELAALAWMVERFIPGRELTCAVIGDAATDVTEIIPAENLAFYDYEAKYAPGASRHILPAELSSDIYQSVQNIALAAHRALGCRGVSRADFRLNEAAPGGPELICLEVNTQPGMTKTSLVPELAAHAGLSFAGLVRWMVEDASCNR